MKEYLHIKYLEIPIYRAYLIIIITNSCEKLEKRIPDFNDDSLYAQSRYINFKGRQGFAAAFNFDSIGRKITHGCIAHESIHLANFIADYRGFKADFYNDEPIAYLVDWITDEIYKFIMKCNFIVQ